MTSRARSLWGWGWDDKLPDEAARAALGAQLAGLLGVPAPAPGAPPTPESAVVPPPRLAIPAELSRFATDDREARARRTYGRAYPDLVRAFSGDFSPAPDLVLTPEDEDDVVASLAWAEREGVAVVPYGGGTSVVGGVEAPRDRPKATLDLARLRLVLEVDQVSRAARIQAGALGPDLEQQLSAHGLTLRHYPQSFEFSTLGGWIATRAGGHYATLMTHVDDLVEAVRMVTPRGVLATRRLPASGAGPSPERLVLGSEGALGVITEAWMRVVPRPRFRASAVVHFRAFTGACAGARAVAQARLFPANCRVLDEEEARLNFVADDGSALLLLGFESADHPVTHELERAVALAVAEGGACPRGVTVKDDGARGGDAAAERWRQAFFDGPYLQSALVTMGFVVDTFETACTWAALPSLDAEVRAAVTEAMRRELGGGRITCRFTHVYPDGPAPYYTWIAPPAPGRQIEAWTAVKRAASDAISRAGGTITHHHAVGRTHRPWYDRERPDAFALALRGAKLALDPAGVLNPGVLIDP
ncbi:MAG: FAD-binding oxidoreductase [Polyangiaceae bacterium]|nr:FAD-binding oxidoreductase [Polyangiaceae bacterium]